MAGRSDNATPQQRFDEKVGPLNENGCRLWLGGTTKKGLGAYGLFYADGGMRPAHRWIFEQAHGKQPPNIDVCHKCDVRLCVNLAHLFAGTRTENMQDAVRKGRTSRVARTQGEKHPMAALTEAQVLEMRTRAAQGEPWKNIARDFSSVTLTSIERAIRRQTWRHI